MQECVATTGLHPKAVKQLQLTRYSVFNACVAACCPHCVEYCSLLVALLESCDEQTGQLVNLILESYKKLNLKITLG